MPICRPTWSSLSRARSTWRRSSSAGTSDRSAQSAYHRAQIRLHFGHRECTVEDATALQRWLMEHVAERDPGLEVVRDELLGRCRKWRVEPPSEGRVERIARSAIHAAQTAVAERIAGRLPAEVIVRIESLVAVDEDDVTESVLALIKSAPGNVSLETMLVEIEKLGW